MAFTLLADAFAPIFGAMLLGFLARHRGLLPDAFWPAAERLVFWLLLPALLVAAIGGTDLRTLPIGAMAGSIWTGLGAGLLAAIVLGRGFRLDHGSFTSALQGTIRFNNLIGLAMAGPLLGPAGLAAGAVASALIVPVVNVILVLGFASGGGKPVSIPGLMRALATNPLILACGLGAALSLSGIGLPPGLGALLRTLGSASTTLGLMTVGAALSLDTLRLRPGLQLAAGVAKLVLVPAATLLAARALGLPPTETAVAVLFNGLPTAVSAYIMARQMGGDAPLIAAITTSQHLVAVATLPAWLLVVRV